MFLYTFLSRLDPGPPPRRRPAAARVLLLARGAATDESIPESGNALPLSLALSRPPDTNLTSTHSKILGVPKIVPPLAMAVSSGVGSPHAITQAEQPGATAPPARHKT